MGDGSLFQRLIKIRTVPIFYTETIGDVIYYKTLRCTKEAREMMKRGIKEV